MLFMNIIISRAGSELSRVEFKHGIAQTRLDSIELYSITNEPNFKAEAQVLKSS